MTPTLRGKRCAIYVRVSTDKQTHENQELQLRKFAERQGWEIAAVYRDVISGKSTRAERHGYDAMLTAAEAGEFDILLFWSLDRITRNGVLTTLQILEQLTAWGVAWVSKQEEYLRSLGPFADAVIAIMATLAKQSQIGKPVTMLWAR